MGIVRRTFLVVIVLVVCASGCSSGGDEASGGERGDTVVAAEVRYPFSTPEEKRTFTDAWVTGTVTAELVGEFDGPEPSEGTQGRQVTIQVDDTEWQRPDLTVPAATVPIDDVEVSTYVEEIASATPIVADDVGDVDARLAAWEAEAG